MNINLDLFLEILRIDSTSSQEGALARFIAKQMACDGCAVSMMPASALPDEPSNVLFSWGEPEVVFCTHLDTVPPYIPPTVEALPDGDVVIRGRGACDAKGQIISMYAACRELASRGESDFGLLLLYGEETGSYGAKQFRNSKGGKYVIVGEPTDNKMALASKGTKAFEVTIHGRAFHSGYPEHGDSAVERFVDFANALRAIDFPDDPLLGSTTYNIGKLVSDNPQNIVSDRLTCRVYFRTTFASDEMVSDVMQAISSEHIEVKALGGDTPSRYFTVEGLPTTVVSFGSDAPQLSNFQHKALCGPGTILVAHTADEYVRLSDLNQAAQNYVNIYAYIKNKDKKHNEK